DVMKHAVLVQLLRALQQKEKGLLYLDSHAGRGCYDLAAASRGDTRLREPEWPEGIGRLWSRRDLSAPLMEYVSIVRDFDHARGNRDTAPRFYPGSPCIVRSRIRAQDRIALFEKHPEEFAALTEDFQFASRTTVQAMDGYVGLRAMLPPPERRALVLIDPAFEAQDEFAQVASALRDGLKRLPAGVFVIWYPLTERARVNTFVNGLTVSAMPPTLNLELAIAGERSGMKMRGCGLVVLNPPWKFDLLVEPMLRELAGILSQAEGSSYRVEWLVPEK
ncbi:MAG TPA: 23S rRNA (adenine(2030)-N(6))-methyltransferase RlmJ, partial [Opitutus sp.]|nr:23S rRNA (adenine(2030)-N(6))-methyltransferase RlmJ [Opitutus sp.]